MAPSLGVTDLTLALHYCYNTPVDKLIWDVGHQAYAHKVITGRRDRFSTLRQLGGISGFPRISESEYDAVSVGHASTSISTALGIAVGRDLRKETFSVVAVIGDGSLSGGLAFEGLNNVGSRKTNLTVVLNDNEMSISKNVGALSRYLTRVLTDRRYNKLKSDVWELLGHMSNVGKSIRSLVQNVDDALKHILIPGKLFEDMGFRYFGPVDGHNIAEMVEIFNFIKTESVGPNLIHIITKKGKGYSFAEENATRFHGVGSFSKHTGTPNGSPATTPTYSEIFGTTLCEIARTRCEVVAITAAMPDGTGLALFREKYPDRFFDVGIAEEHAVTFAAGLALQGLRPVVALYSTFLQRAYDQLMHDVALDKLNIVFCIDRAGLVGEDGPTHHGVFDAAFLRTIPGAVIMAPADGQELAAMLITALNYNQGPVFIRYPRGSGPDVLPTAARAELPIGKPFMVKPGTDCAIIALGDMVGVALKACDLLAENGINPALINARFIKPLDATAYHLLFGSYRTIVTIENNTLIGGFGSAINDLLSSAPLAEKPRILTIGLPDQFIEHGSLPLLYERHKLDSAGIAEQITAFVNKK